MAATHFAPRIYLRQPKGGILKVMPPPAGDGGQAEAAGLAAARHLRRNCVRVPEDSTAKSTRSGARPLRRHHSNVVMYLLAFCRRL